MTDKVTLDLAADIHKRRSRPVTVGAGQALANMFADEIMRRSHPRERLALWVRERRRGRA